MKNIVCLSYADRPDFLQARARLNNCLRHAGITDIISYSRQDIINSPFYQENRLILDQPRGGGYWLWKPYLIKKTLEQAGKNDIVFYNDARNIFTGEQTHHLREVVTRCGLYLRDDPAWRRNQYTKRDAFVLMGLDYEKYWHGGDLTASLLAFTKPYADLVDEWLFWARNPFALTDCPNICGLPNLPAFIDHRHDQAILALLQLKYNLPKQTHDAYKTYRGEFRQQVPLDQVVELNP